jgi:DNA-binding NarL/FixJ family response regulator
MAIRILLVDDHKIIRAGLRNLIHNHNNMEIVGETDTGRTALKLAQKLAPDIIIMDISMPDMNGIDATRKIKTEIPNVKIIALSMHSDRKFVSGMIKAGASGYVLKDCAFDELVDAIKTTMTNHTYLSPAITDIVLEDYKHKYSEDGTEDHSLTNREREIVQLFAEGMSTKEIAYKLAVSAKTVETHRLNIMSKLKISSIAELTKYAIREGITSVDH